MASKLLFHSVNQGDLQQCQCLIIEGCADLNYRNSLGEGAVHVAATRGLPAVMELLLASGADPNVALYREYGGATPLHVGTNGNALRVVEVLLEYNADANVQDALGMTPLHHAARAGNDEIALLLLAYGSCPDAPDHFDKPPAYYAQLMVHTGVLNLLPQSTYNWKEARAKETARIHV